ncbi:MAG: permease-like cell division protein FtsX [Bacteroidales bacterium]|nr:permease-like cell division protein FtsX [Bacteroidales bacterium]
MYSENKSTKRRFAGSYFVSMISISLVLFVLGMYAFLMAYTDRLLDHVKENIGFEVVIKSNAKEASIKNLKDEISKKKYVKSVEYISKEEATNRLKEDLGEDFLQWLGEVENPLLPSIDIRFVSDYANNDSMAMVEKWLGNKTIVKEVIYQKGLTNTINTNIKRVKFALFTVSLVLLFIAIVLISHTIRLSVYSKRFIVRSMQLVGATEGFIMKPFLKTFMKQGLIAAFIALICMTFTLAGIKQYLPEADLFQNNMHIFKIYISIIGISLILTMCSTFFSMKRYLDADIDRLYA